MTKSAKRSWYAREWRKGLGLTLEQVAAELGTSPGYISDMEMERRRHNSDWADKLAKVYGINALDLYHDPQALGQQISRGASKTVAVVGFVGAGAVATLFAEGQGPFDYVEAPLHATATTVGLSVQGVSLGPAFDEALLFYDDVRSPVTPDLHGRLCVVGLPDGRVLVKILRSAGDGTFHLLSNTAEEPLLNQDVEWAAKVTDIRPR